MTFNLIKQYGAPKKATTLKNQPVARQEELFVPEYGQLIKCAPYDDHFIYESDAPEQSAYMCTCGSPAVVVPPGPGGMFVCLHHATYTVHTTSVINRKDFEKTAGELVRVKKVRKWG